jgi:VanZ family protein
VPNKKLFFFAAILWTMVILILCLIQSDKLPVVRIANLDKYVHAFLHFVFTTLWILFFRTQIQNANRYKPLFVSFMLSVILGIVVEILQKEFTTSRAGDTFDVLANISGAAISVFLVLFYDSLKQSKT